MGARHQKRTQRILESQIDRLYDNRAKEMRFIFIIIMGSNVYNMIRTPLFGTVISQVMLSIYWILTLFSLFFMSLSYIKNDLRYIRPSYAILAVSNILGIYNFEGKQIEVSQEIQSLQFLVIFYFVSFFLINSKPSKYKQIQTYFFCSFLANGIIFGYEMLDFSSLHKGAISILGIMAGNVVGYSFQKIQTLAIDDLFEQIQKNFLQQEEFK